MGKQGDGSRRDGFDQTVFCYPRIADRRPLEGVKPSSLSPAETSFLPQEKKPPYLPSHLRVFTTRKQTSPPLGLPEEENLLPARRTHSHLY